MRSSTQKAGRYGPNTAPVEAFLAKVRAMTPEQEVALGAHWVKAWNRPAWNAAWHEVLGAVWESTFDPVPPATLFSTDSGLPATRGAITDVFEALMFRDVISKEAFDLLYRPWRSVMEVEGDDGE